MKSTEACAQGDAFPLLVCKCVKSTEVCTRRCVNIVSVQTHEEHWGSVQHIPIEPIVAGGLGITVRDTQEAKFVGLLRWLRIGRMYPIFEVFATIQHKHILPPVVLTLARNYVSAPDHTQSSCTACFRTRELWECT
eukprot:1162053-Pelagomonas_calceolata.AAC.13